MNTEPGTADTFIAILMVAFMGLLSYLLWGVLLLALLTACLGLAGGLARVIGKLVLSGQDLDELADRQPRCAPREHIAGVGRVHYREGEVPLS